MSDTQKIVLPEKIGDYVVLSLLGQGSSAVVYKCFDPKHNCNVAIKEFLYHNEYVRELSIIKKINDISCMYFIEYYETLYNGQTGYIVMELLDGNLYDLINKLVINNKMNIRALKKIIFQLLEALIFLDDLGIVHFDIKPLNIGFIINDNDEITLKIFDFGISETIDTVKLQSFQKDITNGNIVKQTYCYRAFFDIKNFFGPISDIWSLACIIYEIFTKNILFEEVLEHKSYEENINSIMNTLVRLKYQILALDTNKIDEYEFFSFVYNMLIIPRPARFIINDPYIEKIKKPI